MKKQGFIRGSAVLMLSAAAAKVLGALFRIPLTNMLGGVGMSYFSCAYSLFLPVYALAVTGISAAVARLTAQSAALGMAGNIRRIRRTAYLLFGSIGAAGSVLTVLLAKPFCTIVSDCPEALPAVMMISPAVFLGCVTAVGRGYYEGLSNMYPTAVSQVVEGAVKALAGLWLCSFVMQNSRRFLMMFPQVGDARALAAAAGILGVSLSSAGAVLYLALTGSLTRRPHDVGGSVLVPHREIVRSLLGTALPVGIGAVVTNLTALIDMWTVIGCIPRYSGQIPVPAGTAPDELPHFVYGSFAGIALTVFNLIPSVTNMLGKGALPLITEAWAANDRSALRRGTMQALLTAAAVAIPAAFGLAVLSGEALTLLFPRQTDEVRICANSLRLLMPAMVCLCVSYPVFSMLQAIGRAGAPIKIMLLGTAVKLAGNLLLIPRLGVDGAAVSTTLCYAVILAVSLHSYAVHSGIKPSIPPLLKVLYAGAMCGGATYLMKYAAARNGISGAALIALAAAAGGAVYIAVLWGYSTKRMEPPRAERGIKLPSR